MPPWALPAGIAVVVLIVLLLILKSCTGGSKANDAGSCLSDLLPHIPANATTIAGTDLVQARHAGYDDSDQLDVLFSTRRETGVVPDGATTALWIGEQVPKEDFEAQTGLKSTDITCSLGTKTLSVMTGSFDAKAIGGTEVGSKGLLAANDDVLAYSAGKPAAKTLLDAESGDGAAGDKAVVATLERLREDKAYSLIVQLGDGTSKNGRALAAGVGVTGSGDERSVVLVWTFDDEDAAAAGRPQVAERVNKQLQGSVTVSESALTVDGNQVTAVVPTLTLPDLQQKFNDSLFRLVTPPS